MNPLAFLIYCSLLERAQYRQLRDLAAIQPDAIDIGLIDRALRQSVDKRLELAEEFITFAESLSSGDDVISGIAARNAISRAYYAAHHAMRALLLFEERGDVDGHRESIQAVYALLKRNPAARSKLGAAEDFRDGVLDLLDKRHLADYYPYGTNAPNEPAADFSPAAVAALGFARRIVNRTREYITQKEAGDI